jgi:hypothetical protein
MPDDHAEDDIETLAEITARKAIEGYEPVPHYIVKEVGRNSSMLESWELVGAVITADAIHEQVFDGACELLDAWNADGSLWWPKAEPEPPFDDPPREDTETGENGSF